MKAAVLYENNKQLQVDDIIKPEISNNELLVKVKACGVCHTDLHYIDHGVRTFKPYPIVLGHEASGVVVQKGDNVHHLNINDRVVIPAVLTCGNCRFCKVGKTNLCENMIMPGNHINGAYAEYISVPAKDVKILPDNFSFIEGALIADAFSTAYHAVINRAKFLKGSNVILFGCGGVGLSTLILLKQIGANTIAIDIDNRKLDYAKQLGADQTVNLTSEDISSIIKNYFGKRIDYIFEVVGDAKNLELAIKMARPSTKIVVVGFMSEKSTIKAGKIMFYELDLFGSLGCPPENIPDIFNFVKRRKLDIKGLVTNTYSIEDINIAFDTLRSNKGIRSAIVFE